MNPQFQILSTSSLARDPMRSGDQDLDRNRASLLVSALAPRIRNTESLHHHGEHEPASPCFSQLQTFSQLLRLPNCRVDGRDDPTFTPIGVYLLGPRSRLTIVTYLLQRLMTVLGFPCEVVYIYFVFSPQIDSAGPSSAYSVG